MQVLVDGVIGGVGSVIVFLPNIMILYLFIAFMEDIGLPSAAQLSSWTKFMHTHRTARQVVHSAASWVSAATYRPSWPRARSKAAEETGSSPYCSSPSCRAAPGIPIYILLIGTFFAAYASWVMLGLYLLGIVVAVITARLMRRYLFKKDETPFVMELPPYRVPTMRATLSHMWDSPRATLAQVLGGADSNRFGGGLVLELLSDAGRQTAPAETIGGTL